jgi:hypothetical protein
LESVIAKLEDQRAECEKTLASPDVFSDAGRAKEAQEAFQKAAHDLQSVNNKWERLATEIDALNAAETDA